MKILLLSAFLSISGFCLTQSEGYTFNVDDVETTQYPLKDTLFRIVAENRFRKRLYTFPDELNSVEVASSYMNGFLYAVHTAYADHRPLVLSPDDVWLTICQGFGQHMVVHADSLESLVLQPDHPDKLVIRNDDLVTAVPKAWEELIAGFSNEIQNYAQEDILELVAADFSTTTPTITTAYQATLMDAMKRYFAYTGESGCGIPSVTLLGTPEDWKKICDDFEKFRKYGLDEWIDALSPVLKEFHNASMGNPTPEYWKSIYKDVSMYGTSAITGWILKFFPYIDDVKLVGERKWDEENEYIHSYRWNPYLKKEDYLLSGLSSSDIPKGYIDLDFLWNEYLPSGEMKQHKMKLYSGFIGVTQNKETKAVRPHIAWAICEETEDEYEYVSWEKYRRQEETFEHEPDSWIPGIIDNPEEVDTLPIFNPEKNISFEESVEEITQLVKKNKLSGKKPITAEITIAWNGKLIVSNVSGGTESEQNAIVSFLESLPDWKPATKKSWMLIDDIDAPVNYRFTITF